MKANNIVGVVISVLMSIVGVVFAFDLASSYQPSTGEILMCVILIVGGIVTAIGCLSKEAEKEQALKDLQNELIFKGKAEWHEVTNSSLDEDLIEIEFKETIFRLKK